MSIASPRDGSGFCTKGVMHLERYLDEFEFRFNNRHNPYVFRDTLLRLLASSNLEYKELAKEKAAKLVLFNKSAKSYDPCVNPIE